MIPTAAAKADGTNPSKDMKEYDGELFFLYSPDEKHMANRLKLG